MCSSFRRACRRPNVAWLYVPGPTSVPQADWCLWMYKNLGSKLARHPHLDESFINSIFNPPSTHTDVAMHMGALASPAPPGTVGSPLAANPGGKRPAENPSDAFFDSEAISTIYHPPNTIIQARSHSSLTVALRCDHRARLDRLGLPIPRAASPRSALVLLAWRTHVHSIFRDLHPA